MPAPSYDAEKAQSVKFHARLQCATEDRNRLNRDIVLEEFTLGTALTGGRILIEDSTLKLLHGQKYGLVGRNGVGKTTLLRALAGHRIEGIFSHMRCVYVDDGSEEAASAHHQVTSTAPGSDSDEGADTGGSRGATAIEFLLAQHADRKRALEELRGVMESDGDVNLEWLEDVCRRLASMSAERAEADARRILDGLGVVPDSLLRSLSGGWRHRVALAAALLVDCDLLLLDEPTRSLDIVATTWLERFLRQTKVTVVVVSHDVEFLDNFTTHIVQLEDQRLRTFPGDHTGFLNAIAASDAHQRRAYNSQEARRKRWEATIARMQSRAELVGDAARAVRSRKIAMEKRLGQALDGTYWKYCLMGPRPLIEAPKTEEPVDFELLTDVSDIPESAGDGETLLLRLDGAGYKYSQGPMVIAGVSVDVTLSTRLALVGPNGTGKTTILSILAGERDPTVGEVLRFDGLRIAYLPQDAAKTVKSELPPARWLQQQHPTLSTDEAIDALRGFGLAHPATLDTPVTLLSDGQRTRLLLARVQCDQPHLLLLDEPTGHLDAQSAAALASALDFFAGAVVFASHDRMFIRSIDPTLLVFQGGQSVVFDGDVNDYVQSAQQALAKGDHVQPVGGAAKESRAARSGASNSQPSPVSQAAGGKPGSPSSPAEAPTSVKCRVCGDAHFTFACEKKKEIEKEKAERAAAAKERAEAAQRSAPKIKLGEKASDGKGDWKVVVPKQVKKQMRA